MEQAWDTQADRGLSQDCGSGPPGGDQLPPCSQDFGSSTSTQEGSGTAQACFPS